ncbi:hypothetical protein EM95_024300 [Vibrio parahaemolyticus]|nr:hypothetical protein EM95_024300 [Vibrio parahaemolyticus]
MKADYPKPDKQPNTHWLFVIQEPQKSLCFSQASNNHEMQTFSNKTSFGPENTKATNLQRNRKPQLTCPFHTLSQ